MLEAVWKRLEEWLAQHGPEMLKYLPPPATEAEIEATEAALGVRLPEDVRTSWLIHDGTNRDLSPYGYRLCFIDEIVEQWRFHTENSDEDEWNLRWIPIAVNGCGDCYYLNLEESTPTYGQVTHWFHDNFNDPIADAQGSFQEWLQEIVDGLESGKYIFDAEDCYIDVREENTFQGLPVE